MSNTPLITSAPPPKARFAAAPSFWRAWILDFYSKTYFYNIRMGRKLLPIGKALLAFAAASFLMILDPSRISMRYAFTLCLASFATAALLNFARQPRHLAISRSLPARVVEGSAFDYLITVTNQGRFASAALLCRDHGRLRFPTVKDWASHQAPFDSQLNAFDRWVGYPKWIWLVEMLQDVIGYDFEIPPLAPGQSVTLSAQGRAGKRGKRLFLGFYCALSDPFNILQRLFYVKSKQVLLVLPKPLHCGISIPMGSRSLSAGDSRDLLKSGDSEEFRSLREWRSGDPFKRIDWKATARSGMPIAREYAPEYKLRTALVFDTSLPDGVDEQAFEDAMGYAAGMVVSIDRKDRNIDLLVLADHVVSLQLGQGTQDHILALEKLASCDPSHETSLATLEESILSASSKFSSAVLVCPSWTARHAQCARHLAAEGIGLAIIVCSKPLCQEFPQHAPLRVFDGDAP